ncbi:MAG: hypothetical protein V7K26_29010 [Nostoc sp.]
MVNDTPTAALTPEFRVVLCKNLADFTDLVGIGYFGSLHYPLHNIFYDAMRWYFPIGRLYSLLPCFGLNTRV